MTNKTPTLGVARGSLSYGAVDIPRPPQKKTGRYVGYGVTALVLVVGVSVGLRRLRPAAPSVEHGTIWMGKVQRGPMVREVLGQGTLVPEEIQWIAAKTNARVEKVPVKPGAIVKADTIILELSNTDLELQALEADRQLSQAQAELVNLQATLNSQKLSQ